jgi:hypothetical protein
LFPEERPSELVFETKPWDAQMRLEDLLLRHMRRFMP